MWCCAKSALTLYTASIKGSNQYNAGQDAPPTVVEASRCGCTNLNMSENLLSNIQGVPSLLPFPGDGERQASLSSEVASCRGKDIECANLLNEANQERRHADN